ncbi:hypothetical protein ACSSQ8_003268 [Cronobacter sakazakii]|uniref:hypothetical protein n=1 Tax=Cronobacter dublinensis TaxID=413497 RepID=UPI000CFF1B5C|nr:hypothetical protein [Cronobacter dublinensis]MDK1304578.1 hypothetical protein [Cronobacter sakazakii]
MTLLTAIIKNPAILSYLIALLTLIIIIICKKWYVLSKENLFQQKLFWFSIFIPLLSFIYFGIFAWWGKTPVLSAHGYARFYEISKFPLLILASSVPLASIVNNIHRTIQTESQISTAESKNAIDRYLAHEKNFIEKIKEIGNFSILETTGADGKIKPNKYDSNYKIATKDSINITNPYHLYKKMYPSASMKIEASYNFDQGFISKIEESLNIINNNLERKESDNTLKEPLSLHKLNAVSYNIALLFEHLCIDNISLAFYKISDDKEEIKIYTDNEFMFIEILEAAYHISRKLTYLITGNELSTFENILSYIYDAEPGFDIFNNARFQHSIYSPSWLAYVAPEVRVITSGDNMAAK